MYRYPLVTLFFAFSMVLADVPLPTNVLNPITVPEAWNIIRLTRTNVAKLLEEKRMAEVPEQISLCSPALRLLARTSVNTEQRQLIDEHTSRAFSTVNTIAQCCMFRSQSDADKAFVDLKSSLSKLESVFTTTEVCAEIYYCTIHPEIVSSTLGAICPKCQAQLRIRRIPYSFIYVIPSAPTISLSLTPQGPLVAGQETKVDMKLRTLAGTPVSISDLQIVHAKPIHLFLLDPTLELFQAMQPMPGEKAGDYSFSFTPLFNGPCRIWADIVPVATGLQELPYADIGGVYLPIASKEAPDIFSTTTSGYTFELSFSGGNNGQISAKEIQLMRIKVTDSSGKLVDRLEPIMSAFAQVVGFYDDHQTVLRLHPIGGDILRDDLRGGPHLGFKIYAPRPGFVRFYCQVRIDGKTLTAPFCVNVGR